MFRRIKSFFEKIFYNFIRISSTNVDIKKLEYIKICQQNKTSVFR
jgi:hypothetical protein